MSEKGWTSLQRCAKRGEGQEPRENVQDVEGLIKRTTWHYALPPYNRATVLTTNRPDIGG